MWTAAPERRVRPRLLAKYPLSGPGELEAAAPAHRRRLQRLVDVHDPARRSPRNSGSRCRCSSSGTTSSTACAPVTAGYPTVTMPGAAIWHMAWSDKDDAIDWQAYFHLRNRLVVAALHMPGNGRGLVLNTVKATLKHLLCLEYSTVAIQNQAIADFLAGPGAHLRTAADRARQRPRHAQGVPGRRRAAVVDRTAAALAAPTSARSADPGNPLAKVVPARQGPGAQRQARARRSTTSARSSTCRRSTRAGSCSRRSTASPSPPRTGVASSTASATRARPLELLKEAMRLRRELATALPGTASASTRPPYLR